MAQGRVRIGFVGGSEATAVKVGNHRSLDLDGLRRLVERDSGTGKLDFSAVEALEFTNCRFKTVDLQGLRFPGLLAFRTCNFSGRLQLGRIDVLRLEIKKCTLPKGVSLEEAFIHGVCDLSGGTYGSTNGSSTSSNPPPPVLINLRRSRIEGRLCMTGATLKDRGQVALRADEARIGRNFQLNHGFTCDGALNLKRISIQGSLDCRGAKLGEIPEENEKDPPQVKGNLDALNAAFCFIAGDALFNSETRLVESAGELKYELLPFKAYGGIDLTLATVQGGVECVGGTLVGRKGSAALKLDDARVDGHVRIVNYHPDHDPSGQMLAARSSNEESRKPSGKANVWIEEGVRLQRAKIGHRLEVEAAWVFAGSPGAQEPGTLAIDAHKSEIGGGLKICTGKLVATNDPPTASATEPALHGRLDFGWSKIEGGVDLRGATVRADWDLDSPWPEAAINLKDCEIQGDVLLGEMSPKTDDDGQQCPKRYLDCLGLVDLSRSQISGKLDARCIKIKRSERGLETTPGKRKIPPRAIRLDNTRVGVYAGFSGAQTSQACGAKLDCVDGEVSVLMRGTEIEGGPLWLDFDPHHAKKIYYDLRAAKVEGALLHVQASWPRAGRLCIQGLEYKDLELEPVKKQSETLKDWLALQWSASVTWWAKLDTRVWPSIRRCFRWSTCLARVGSSLSSRYQWKAWLRRLWADPSLDIETRLKPQPHQQLIAVLRRKGQTKLAEEIAIDLQARRMKEKAWWKRLGLSPLRWIGYGYKPARVWPSILIVWLVGAGIFEYEHRAALAGAPRVSQTSENDSKSKPSFSALAYSADVFLPIIDLHQEKHWEPRGPTKGLEGRAWWKAFLPQLYFWVHIILGWGLTTLAVAGFTGIVKKE